MHEPSEVVRHSNSVLSLQDVSMDFGGRLVLDNVSFEAEPGETIALLGPNGAGKSTLIEVAAGLRAPTSGSVRLAGEDPLHASAASRARVGLMLQNWKDHGKWTVTEFLSYMGSSTGDHHLGSAAMIEVLGLSGCENTRMGALSGGQRRRVDVAAALIGRPSVLILDEPTTGFDIESKRSFQEAVESLSTSLTVLWATHDLAEAEAVSDRLAILSRGKFVAMGSAEELREHYGGASTVGWTDASGWSHSAELEDPKPLLAQISSDPGVSDISVQKKSLHDLYLSVMRETEEVST